MDHTVKTRTFVKVKFYQNLTEMWSWLHKIVEKLPDVASATCPCKTLFAHLTKPLCAGTKYPCIWENEQGQRL